MYIKQNKNNLDPRAKKPTNNCFLTVTNFNQKRQVNSPVIQSIYYKIHYENGPAFKIIFKVKPLASVIGRMTGLIHIH